MLTRSASVVGVLVCIGCVACVAGDEPKTAAPGYKVLKEYKLGGAGRWDYLALDAVDHRLFVSRETHVMVVDPETGKIVGDIPDTTGVHGIAFARDLGRGFTSNGRANTSTIFDLKTLKPLGTVKTGENPDAILFDPFSKRVFTMNGRSNDATAFDPETAKVLGTIKLEGKPEFGVSDGAGHLYVNLEDKSEVVRVDPKELKVTARWSLAPGEGPSGLALDVKNHRLFSVCDNKLMIVLDAESGKVVDKLQIGARPDAAAFDPETKLAFSSNGDGTMTVVHEEDPSHFAVVETVKTATGARTMALDAKTHNIFLPTARFEPLPVNAAPRQRPTMVPDTFMILVVGR